MSHRCISWAAISGVFFFSAGCSIITGLTAGPLPEHDGTLSASGLQSPVEVLRDKWGVPHIYAQNRHDLFFAQGYTHAQDRWWEMELFRHVGRGALSEMLGNSTLSDDIYLRTLHLYETAQQEEALLEPETRAAAQSFTDGVNAYIMSRPPERLAMEYAALSLTGTTVQVTPWSVADSLVFGKIIEFQQGSPMNDEAVMEDVLAKVGAARMKYWSPPLPYGVKPTILQESDLAYQNVLSAKASGPLRGLLPSPSGGMDWTLNAGLPRTDGPLLHDNAAARNNLYASVPGLPKGFMSAPLGSNSWIVNASLSKTGRPILENDPHLGMNTPSLYYEIALHSAGNDTEAPMEMAGVAFPAFLGVAIGHNAKVAWGITIGKGVDAWDTYEIKVNPQKPLEEYLWNGQYVPFALRSESFNIAGADPVTVHIRSTIHGPIINDTFVQDGSGVRMIQSNRPLALRWVGLDPGRLGDALYQLQKAADWKDFHSALRYWYQPSCNLSYADSEGNIGYQLTGTAPVRAKNHSGLTPAPGWTSAYLWKGFVDYDDFPFIYNPSRGFIIHTNQAVAPPDFFGMLAAKYGADVNVYFQPTSYYGYRAERLTSLLDGTAPFSLQDFARIQADVAQTSVDDILPYVSSLTIAEPPVAAQRDSLMQWDHTFTTDSTQATYYWLFYTHLLKDIYEDEAPVPEPPDGAMYAVKLLLAEPNNDWWDDKTTVGVVEDRDTILQRALTEANTDLHARYGDNQADWVWGKAHTLTFVNNPLGVSGIGLLEGLVNRGPYGLPGTQETVNLAEAVDENGTFNVGYAPFMRMILDVGDWDNSLIDLAPGQSGHPASGNYSDQIQQWIDVQHRNMAWTRPAVEATTEKRLTLQP